MKLLAVETATSSCSVALCIEGEITERFVLSPSNTHSQQLFNLINDLLNEYALKISDLNALAFGSGPGSFTGVRLAASCIQGLAFSYNLPVIAISSLQVLAQSAFRLGQVKNALVAHDAKMGEVYWGQYQIDTNHLMQPCCEDQLLKPEEIRIEVPNLYIGCGNAWQIYRDIFQNQISKINEDTSLSSQTQNKTSVVSILSEVYPHAYDLAQLALGKYEQGAIIKAHEALPQYLRQKVTNV